MRRERRWFIEHRNDDTNKAVARRLQDPENAPCIRKCERGKTLKVWECSLDDRDYFINCKEAQGLDFRVWIALGEDKLRRWYPNTAKRKAIKSVALIAQMIRAHRISGAPTATH